MASHGSEIRLAHKLHRRLSRWPVWIAARLWVGAVCAQVGLLLAAQVTLAKSNDPNSDNAPTDVQDLLFFGPLRPVWIRLRIFIDGQPFREVWGANVRNVFADADADDDGIVHGPSGQIAPPGPAAKSPPDSIAGLAELAAVYLGQDVAQARSGLEKTAEARSGDLTLAGFEEYFWQTAPPFAIAVGVGRTTAGQALFPLLDVDGDQQLTPDELNGAETRLRIRDFDDNESLTRLELVDAPNSSLAAVAQATVESQPSPLVMAGPVAMLGAAHAEMVREAIFVEYDRNHDGKLATSGDSAEITPTEDQLLRLGAKAGEAFGSKQLESFCTGTPDLELKVELGKVSMANRRFSGARARRTTDDEAPATRLKQRPDGSWDVTLDDAHIFLRRNNRDPSKNSDTGPSLQNFDADNNGYLDETELAGVPNLAGAFEIIDADHDGKIFSGELESYSDRQNRAASVRLLLEVFDQGQELFDHLDENHDYRLSTRELHNAAETVKQIDANHDGRLSAGEIPQQLVLELSRNTPSAAVTERRSIRGGERIRTAAKRGPSWFQKMDRNDDSELSPREFLGPADLFKRLDQDHNGVIDAKEAEAKS
jgi:Ca2+-binding EF-hand superfamily protein